MLWKRAISICPEHHLFWALLQRFDMNEIGHFIGVIYFIGDRQDLASSGVAARRLRRASLKENEWHMASVRAISFLLFPSLTDFKEMPRRAAMEVSKKWSRLPVSWTRRSTRASAGSCRDMTVPSRRSQESRRSALGRVWESGAVRPREIWRLASGTESWQMSNKWVWAPHSEQELKKGKYAFVFLLLKFTL